MFGTTIILMVIRNIKKEAQVINMKHDKKNELTGLHKVFPIDIKAGYLKDIQNIMNIRFVKAMW